jgi:hypothetical protein
MGHNRLDHDDRIVDQQAQRNDQRASEMRCRSMFR